jgi:hypothetical protein
MVFVSIINIKKWKLYNLEMTYDNTYIYASF